MMSQTNRAPISQTKQSRVPRATVDFWIVLLGAMILGEAAADCISSYFNLGLSASAGLMSLFLSPILALQLTQGRYAPLVFWMTLPLVSIAGTVAADLIVEGGGIDARVATAGFAGLLGVLFGVWHTFERSASFEVITTMRRESFFWLASFLMFALRSAANDILSDLRHLHFLVPCLIWLGLIGLLVASCRLLNVTLTKVFWFLYLLVGLLGGTLADLVSQPFSRGGLGVGAVVPTLAAVTLIVAFIPYMILTKDGAKIRYIHCDFQ